MKRKILMLFCGGTIAMSPDEKTGALRPAKSSKELLELVPKVKELVDLDVIELFNIDSTEVTSKHWKQIVDCISENYDKYEGFVITHGTDTMVDSGCAISLAFGKHLTKPIVLTGSQTHIEAVGTDAKFNLENVFRVVCCDIPEVMISFGHFVLRASRSQKKHESDYNAFHSPNFLPLANIRAEIEWSPVSKRSNPMSQKGKINNNFEDDILTIKVNAGLSEKLIEKIIKDGTVKGIVFESLGAGNIPSKYLNSIKVATENNIPCLIASPFIGGTTHATTYELGYEALKVGAIETHDMTATAIYIKLMWCLHQVNEKIKLGILNKEDLIPTIREMFNTDYVGEVSL